LTVIRPDANARSGDTRIDLASCAVFKVRREGAEPHGPSPYVTGGGGAAGLSKLNSVRDAVARTRPPVAQIRSTC